jgi:tubulin beta
MQDLSQIAGDVGLGELYRPDNIIGNDEGSGNCYAKAFHTEGPDLAERVLEVVRKEVERCSCLQGVQFTHAISGGTGSGLTGLLVTMLNDYLSASAAGKCIIQTWTVLPGPRSLDMLLAPYNSCLALEDLVENADMVYCFDNTALQDICTKFQDMETPKFNHMNNIIACCMSGLTSCLRYSGPLNADLRKLHTNLVPFPKNHFLINGFAPLTPPNAVGYRNLNVKDLAQQMMSRDSVSVKCDPLCAGDPDQGIPKARFLASWASWRGDWKAQEVDEVHHWLQKDGSRYDKFFPDWIPNSIGSNICTQPHCDKGKSVTFVSNSTAIHEVFDRTLSKFHQMYKKKSFLSKFEEEGVSADDMLESAKCLEYISDQYKHWAGKEDKILDGQGFSINEKCVQTDEERSIAEWLSELAGPYGDGGMCIEMRDTARTPGASGGYR